MISNHTFSVARYFYHELKNLHHGNSNPLAVIYCDTGFDDINTQGAVVNFNILRANGQYAGFAEVRRSPVDCVIMVQYRIMIHK